MANVPLQALDGWGVNEDSISVGGACGISRGIFNNDLYLQHIDFA